MQCFASDNESISYSSCCSKWIKNRVNLLLSSTLAEVSIPDVFLFLVLDTLVTQLIGTFIRIDNVICIWFNSKQVWPMCSEFVYMTVIYDVVRVSRTLESPLTLSYSIHYWLIHCLPLVLSFSLSLSLAFSALRLSFTLSFPLILSFSALFVLLDQ